MPSNNDLIAAIREIDADAKTEGLTNDQLAALLKDLRAKAEAKAAEDEAAAEKAKADKEAAEAAKGAEAKPAKLKKGQYYVAPGKAITSLKGIQSGSDNPEKPEDGAVIDASFFSAGEDAITALRKRKAIVE